MRYNDYKHDNESLVPNCTSAPGGVCTPPYSASLSIAARGDLNLQMCQYGYLGYLVGQLDEAATDAKIASWSAMKEKYGFLIAGPPYENLPPFRWSTSPFSNLTHLGMPDEMKFDW